MESDLKGSVDLINKIANYSKHERIIRLIEISVKANPTLLEQMEVATIQTIRQVNGEIDEVIKQREQDQ